MAQVNWSRELLAARSNDEKEVLACLRGNKEGVSAEVLLTLAQREKHGPAVASVAGQYFEKGDLDQDTPTVLRVVAARPDIGAQTIAYAALSPSAPELIVGFASSKRKDDQLIAARMIAATAVMRRPQDRETQRMAEKMVGVKSPMLNVNYREQLKLLLGSDDLDVLEYTLLAAGIDRVGFVKEDVAGHLTSRDEAVAMAAQFAHARLRGAIDEAAVLKQINTPPRRSTRRPRRGEPDASLNYDPRDNARVYAIMAAGAARLESAIDPLLGLLHDEDRSTAVAAARALGAIGTPGLPVRMLEAMTDKTDWAVRVALYDAVGANPEKASVEPLVERFINERGRFRQDALYALLSIAAGKAQGMTYADFDNWWSQHGEAFEVDPKATRAWREEHAVGVAEVDPIAGFYDSAVISDRPVFAVDASKSMAGLQIESLQKMLDSVVLSFPDYVKFNIVDFGGHVRTLAPGGMIPAENRAAAMQQFKSEMELTLGTRTYDAIERAILIPEMDSVHFLSDGAPYGSHLKGWVKIDYVTRLLCRTTPVAVHMIFFPEPGNAQQAAKSTIAKQMQSYAEAQAGRFVVSVAE